MNNVVLTGRLTKDPETRQTGSGKKFARFTLAVYRDRENTDFISVVAWEKTAELLERYCSKGSMIGVQGRIQTGSYEKEGQKVYTTDIMADRIEFLEKKKEESPEQEFAALNVNVPF